MTKQEFQGKPLEMDIILEQLPTDIDVLNIRIDSYKGFVECSIHLGTPEDESALCAAFGVGVEPYKCGDDPGWRCVRVEGVTLFWFAGKGASYA